MKLSILIPVFNEEKTVSQVLTRVSQLELRDVAKEVIVIDDGSKDGTSALISKFRPPTGGSKIKVITHKKNSGKGAAIRTGLAEASGDFVIIQDADLEYDPNDIQHLLRPILGGSEKVVYGTRLKRLPNFSRDERTIHFFLHYLGNRFLSIITSVLYGQWITDMETCYKVFPKSAINNTPLHARGFEFEPEITAKLMKKGYHIKEVSITTNPRSYDEGKKLNTVRDGLKALWALVKYRFIN